MPAPHCGFYHSAFAEAFPGRRGGDDAGMHGRADVGTRGREAAAESAPLFNGRNDAGQGGRER